MVVGGAPVGGGRSKKKLLFLGAAVAVLVAGASAYVFGFYIPNKPENVYATAMSRTGDGYDRLVKYLSNEKLAEKYKTTDTKGTFKINSPDFSTDGSFSMKGDDKNAAFNLDMGMVTSRLKVDVLAKDVANSESPDLYMKVAGIKGFGSAFEMPGLDSLDNQWITVDHSLIDTFAQSVTQDSGEAMKMPSRPDLSEAYAVVGTVGDKYLFTADKANAVFEMRQYVGRETTDGVTTLHYKVGINKANYKKFVKELATELDKTKLNTWVKENYGGRNISGYMDPEQAAKEIDSIKDSDTADLWVNADTKLIHKVRFNDKNNAGEYVDIGMAYKGGNEYPFFLNLQTSDGVFKLTATLNAETDVVSATGSYKGKGSAAGVNGSFNMTMKPGTGAVKVEVPAGAITLQQALDKAGLTEYINELAASLQGLQAMSEESLGGSGTSLEGASPAELETLFNVQ